MILVRDNIDQIVGACFSDEDRDILEFTQNNTKVTIRDQFLYHYETACYSGTLEQLNKAIMYKIFQHKDLLLKIKDYRENIGKIIELGEYSKVTLGYRDHLGSETTLGASGSLSLSSNIQTDQYSGVDQSENLNIDDQRTATSHTNVVDGIQAVMPQPSINPGPAQNMDTFSVGEAELLKGRLQYKKSTLNNPQIEEGDNPIGYQNLTKDLTTNQTNNTNTTSSSRGSESKNISNSRSSTVKTKGTKVDEVNRTVEYETNDARLKLWKTELPKLQLKFWNIFFNLFEYEQY